MTGYADIYVLGQDRSARFVNTFLDEFLPARVLSSNEWLIPEYSDFPDFILRSVDELLSFCEANPSSEQRAYWCNLHSETEPSHAHVFYLPEGGIILGLSTTNSSLEISLLNRLKGFVGSDLGYITYECPPEDTIEAFARLANLSR